ncbi:hypothetical protein SDJN03_13947, partial [Cucurbita argyrosperma subsp. sororia]
MHDALQDAVSISKGRVKNWSLSQPTFGTHLCNFITNMMIPACIYPLTAHSSSCRLFGMKHFILLFCIEIIRIEIVASVVVVLIILINVSSAVKISFFGCVASSVIVAALAAVFRGIH